MQLGSASILQMNVARVGGLLEAKKIAGMAESFYAQIAPHLYNGPVGAAASIQLAATCPNFLIHEAIMDFGATLCTRHDPACVLCPLQDDCVARREGRVEQLPEAKPGKPLPERRTLMLMVRDARGHVLLARRPETGVWSGMWSLPEARSHDEAREFLRPHALDFDAAEPLPLIEHTFSHYRLHIEPMSWRVAESAAAIGDNAGLRWQPVDRLDEVGLPAPVKKLLGSLTP